MEGLGPGACTAQNPPGGNASRDSDSNERERHYRPGLGADDYLADAQSRPQDSWRELVNGEAHDKAAEQRGDITGHRPAEESGCKDSSNGKDNRLPDKRNDERRRKQEGNHCDELAGEHVLAVVHEGPNV